MTLVRRILLGFILAGVVTCPQVVNAVAIVDNSAGPVIAANPWCTSFLDPSPIAALPAGGADAMGQRASILAQFAGIPGVQVVLGGAAPGTLTIDQYSAWVKGDAGGAIIDARYDDGDGVPDWNLPGGPGGSPRWIQEINTNVPLGGAGSPYIDPRPGDDVKQGATAELPYYWTDKEAIGSYTNGGGANPYDLRFYDRPSRGCAEFVDWEAELFITTENNFTYPQTDPAHVITIHDGIRWGFELIPSIDKILSIFLRDTIESFSSAPTFWGPGIGQSHAGGLPELLVLHPSGAFTELPGQQIPDETFQLLPPEVDLLRDYSFEVLVNDFQSVDVFVNQLDGFLFDLPDGPVLNGSLPIPVILPPPSVQNLSMTINLAEDLLVIVDENQPVRTDNALYIGPFSTFDPAQVGLDLLGIRALDLELGAILNADFNQDGLLDCDDVDSLVAEIAMGGTASQFDLNGDGTVDVLDLEQWLFDAGVTNVGFPYLPGDGNLDGFVDVSDFNIWNTGKFTFESGWCGGDYNADGVADVSDFNVWNTNKFQGPPAVPEPTPWVWLVMLLGWTIRHSRSL